MRLNLFDMNLIRALDAILTERNVTRAADRVNLSQPAMSGALRRLRDHFQDQLLVRVGQSNELTPLGLTLVQPVKELVQQINRTLNLRPVFEPELSTRTFCISATDYVAQILLHPLTKLLSEIAPNVNLQLVNFSDETAGGLIAGQIDLCITVDRWIETRETSETPNFISKTLFVDEYCCIVDANHPDINDALSLETYEKLPHVALRLGEYLGPIVAVSWANANISPRIAVTVPDFKTVARMVEGTKLIGTVPRILGVQHSASGATKLFNTPVRFPPIKESMVWHSRSNQDPGHVFLRNQLSMLSKQIIA